MKGNQLALSIRGHPLDSLAYLMRYVLSIIASFTPNLAFLVSSWRPFSSNTSAVVAELIFRSPKVLHATSNEFLYGLFWDRPTRGGLSRRLSSDREFPTRSFQFPTSNLAFFVNFLVLTRLGRNGNWYPAHAIQLLLDIRGKLPDQWSGVTPWYGRLFLCWPYKLLI